MTTITITIERSVLEQALANMVRAELLYGQPNQAIQEAIRAALEAPATAPELSQHDDLDKVATARYKVVKSKSTIWPCSVVAGDGEQELFSGSESTCKHVARKLTGAFLDGAFYSQSTATLQSATAPKHNPDCRTCQKFINPGDGCLTVVKCEIGSRYSPVSPIYLWETL